MLHQQLRKVIVASHCDERKFCTRGRTKTLRSFDQCQLVTPLCGHWAEDLHDSCSTPQFKAHVIVCTAISLSTTLGAPSFLLICYSIVLRTVLFSRISWVWL
mmetsp:Transcript_6322/g.9416  ORF Transcript_6322/g.9416 Transcript_6322/m.9416 type:complete len:102 (-) Transcript_6322:216-521(-)